MSETHQPGRLKRELGVFHAVLLGLGSILGTGVFVSIGIATGIAGPSVLIAIVLAALLALCNGLSSAQLAAAHPVAGGTYEYAYQYLHPKLGFTAGWMFLLAKSASAATALLAVGGFVTVAAGWTSPTFRNQPTVLEKVMYSLPWTFVHLLILLFCMFAVLIGLRRSKWINLIFVCITLAGILLFGIYGTFVLPAKFGVSHTFQFIDWRWIDLPTLGWTTAFLFVAYTGYGRIATLGEEVHHPKRTIPIAIIVCLFVTTLLYVLAATAMLPAERLPQMRYSVNRELDWLPAAVFWGASDRDFWRGLITLTACVAMLGVLFNLILGLSRVVLAMSRRRDLHRYFAYVDLAGVSPSHAVLLVCVLIAAITVVGDIKTTWSFAAFTVLIYYGITNLAALRLPKENRLYPRVFSFAGLVGCLSLCWFVEPIVWMIGVKLIVLGLLWHALAPKMFGRPPLPTEVCIACGYDLRASKEQCPE
ncbi:MAG: APC family permease, partial [Phycisphaeraceae bacterium]